MGKDIKKVLKKSLGVVLAISLVACGQGKQAETAKPASDANTDKIQVVSSMAILGDMVKNIGGERVEVVSLVGANQDPHMYQATPQDVQKIANAKLLVVNGLGVEGWMSRLDDNAGFKGVKVVTTDNIPNLITGFKDDDEHEHGHEGEGEHANETADEHAAHDHEHGSEAEHAHGDTDPHVWQDPELVAKYYVPSIVQGLTQVDPAGAEYYQKNAEAYIAKLNQLNQQIHALIDAIPPAQRKVVVSHQAFGYFARAYGVEFHAVQGLSTESQASAKHVAELIKEIKSENIKALFMENLSDPKMIQQISAETGAHVGKPLFADTLSDASGPAPSYVQMMQYNAEQIAQGLR